MSIAVAFASSPAYRKSVHAAEMAPSGRNTFPWQALLSRGHAETLCYRPNSYFNEPPAASVELLENDVKRINIATLNRRISDTLVPIIFHRRKQPSVAEANRSSRLQQDTRPFQRGIIRHVVLVLDLSEAMLDKDMRPNRYIITLRYAQEYVREFFEQNPISQMCVLGMHDGLCIRVSDLSGNPNDHIIAIGSLRHPRQGIPKEPKGNPSLQNALEMARGILYHTPKHGTREVIIVFGALLTLDPGDIYTTIRSCVKDRLRVSIIGMSGRMKICHEICSRTNSGDDSSYVVALDQSNFRDLLLATTTPPVIRATDAAEDAEAHKASLLMMGFPSRVEEDFKTLCACHGELSRGGYTCSRCKAKVCNLPATCPSCSLTLILSTHLARSYHHLFPLMNWLEVSWERARELNAIQCKGCLTPFPPIPTEEVVRKQREREAEEEREQRERLGGEMGVPRSRVEGASESQRYECSNCHWCFCIDCDVFCHEVVHNCPGCNSMVQQALPGDEVNGMTDAGGGGGSGGAAVNGALNGQVMDTS
jgi:transcription initiation factor TFIIH subunit 2